MSHGLPKHLEDVPTAKDIRNRAATMHGNGSRDSEASPAIVGAHLVPTWEMISQLADRVRELEEKAETNKKRAAEE